MGDSERSAEEQWWIVVLGFREAEPMGFILTHRDGSMDDGSEEMLDELLSELDGDFDVEHPDVSVTDGDSGWTISAFQGGLVVLENLEDDSIDPRHVQGASRSEMLALMALVARADFTSLENRTWDSGYGS
ncbi:hypothetical protein [Streptomyces mirabilis]|uniref:hypothetical protein n=1 Tax=Streptomyces mirabilis TaxID=68239 RepID=UPI0035D681F3